MMTKDAQELLLAAEVLKLAIGYREAELDALAEGAEGGQTDVNLQEWDKTRDRFVERAYRNLVAVSRKIHDLEMQDHTKSSAENATNWSAANPLAPRELGIV